jgi:acetyltransferase-like isoleucine patch superfamily enzyme
MLINYFYNIFLNKYNQYKLDKIKNSMNKIGEKGIISGCGKFKNPHYISIGDNVIINERYRFEAWDSYLEDTFSPQIIIGNNVCFNTDIHIGCINKIVIGDNCLFGSRIYITDHDHGNTSSSDLSLPPIQRKLYSKGPVIIENNVYVGEGVAILSGVTIGENSIIATNAVVTKSVPKNSLVGGVPARIIKSLI